MLYSCCCFLQIPLSSGCNSNCLRKNSSPQNLTSAYLSDIFSCCICTEILHPNPIELLIVTLNMASCFLESLCFSYCIIFVWVCLSSDPPLVIFPKISNITFYIMSFWTNHLKMPQVKLGFFHSSLILT